MKLFSKFFNKETKEKENRIISPDLAAQEVAAFFDLNSEEIIERSNLNSATYYACMLIRCNAIAKLPIKIKQDTKEGKIDKTEHPLYHLLKNRPNLFMTPHDLKWATEFYRLHYGNAFWAMGMKKGKINAIYLLDSTAMEIIIDDAGILNKQNMVYYLYSDPKKGQIIYTSDEIVHFKNFPTNGIEGISISKYITDLIQSEKYSTKMLKEKYKSGMMQPIVVEYTGEFDNKKIDLIRKKFQRLGGITNAGKVLPIPAEFKAKELNTSLVNNQFFELQGLNAKQIANTFGVKSFQLNDTGKSTYNNIEQQNKAFYCDTLQNVITEYEEEINYKMFLTEEREKGYYAKFNVDSILRSDLETRAKSYESGINTGYMTIAEVREKEDLPFKEGTDKLIIGNGASIPLEDLGKQYKKGGEETLEEDI